MPTFEEVRNTFAELSPHLLNGRQVCDLVDIESSTLNTYDALGKLPSLKLGRWRYWLDEDVERYITTRRERRIP